MCLSAVGGFAVSFQARLFFLSIPCLTGLLENRGRIKSTQLKSRNSSMITRWDLKSSTFIMWWWRSILYIHDCCLIIAWSSDGRSTETSSEWLDDMGVTSWRQTVGGPGGTPMWLSSYVVATPAGRTNVSHAETQMAACYVSWLPKLSFWGAVLCSSVRVICFRCDTSRLTCELRKLFLANTECDALFIHRCIAKCKVQSRATGLTLGTLIYKLA